MVNECVSKIRLIQAGGGDRDMQLIHVYLHTLDAPGAKIRDLVTSHLYKHAPIGDNAASESITISMLRALT